MSQRELYLHIGTHKTGTTALQQFFQMNRDVLSQKGIDYPATPDGQAGHHRLGWSFHKEGGRPSRLYPEDLQTPEKEWASVTASESPVVLVSSESLYRCSQENLRLIRHLAAAFQVKSVIYVRRQDAMILSVFNQITKDSKRTWTDYDTPYDLNYMHGLNRWTEILGKQNMVVRPYEKQQFYGGTIFADFLHYVFGLELMDAFKIPEGDVNTHLHRIVLEYKRLVNSLPLAPERISGILGPLLELSSRFYKEGRSDSSLLSPERRLEIIQEYAPVNEQIARQFLGRPDGRLFYDPPPNSDGSWQPYQRLTPADARVINQYLTEHYPAVLCTVIDGISQSLSCGQADVQDAAEQLLPGILHTPVKDKKRLAALQRRRAEIAGACKPERFVNWVRRNVPEPLKKPARVVMRKFSQVTSG